VFNSAPHSAQEQSPTAKFTGTTEEPKTKNFHHFGCPVYVTDTGMQQGRKGPQVVAESAPWALPRHIPDSFEKCCACFEPRNRPSFTPVSCHLR
jgi:hypothetical protein